LYYKVFFLLLIVFLSTLGAAQKSAPAIILASGNNKFVFPVLLKQFYKKYPSSKIVVEYGASGDLVIAILNGAYYDVFLSADVEFPQKLYDEKKAINPPTEYARGSLVLFIPADSAFHQKKLKVLYSESIKHITIANQESSPYGKATIELLQNAKLFEKVKDKIHYSTDISGVINNVIWYDDAGFVSKSTVNSLPKAYKKEGVNWIEIDENLYSPIVQAYAVSKEGAKNKNAQNFLKFLHSNEGREIYKQYGYK